MRTELSCWWSRNEGKGQRQSEGCTKEALALMEGCTDEALALQRQWWRQSERCTDDTLALMKGCDDEAFALMIARWRQWQRKSERCTYGCGTRAQTKGGTKLWTQCWLKRVDQWCNRQGSGANSCEVETTDTWTKLCTYGCGTMAVNANKALDLAPTQEGWSMTKPPMLESVEHQDEKDRMSQLAWNWCLAHTVPTSMSCTE